MTMINGFFAGNIQSTDTICGCVDIFKNLWPNVEETIDMINASCTNGSAYWEKAPTIGGGVKQNHRVNTTLKLTVHADISNDPLLQTVHNQLYTMLLATTIPYAEKYSIQENLWHEGYNVLRYEEGDQYKEHYDGSTSIGRAVSAICYLNDDYEGGELEFVNFGVTIKPQAGTLLLFPSNYAYKHIAHPVKSGTKYALVTWLRDQDNF
jgi:predicted 2-oxoglutarate/Fe(II)-dependent dioxygenase YbiX